MGRKAQPIDPTQAKREKRNIGPVLSREPADNAFPSLLLVERLLKRLLQDTIDHLKEDKEELTRFFSHFFDPTVEVKERDAFVEHFIRKPPKAQLGYARSAAKLPYYGIVMSDESESDSFVGDHVGEEEFPIPSAYTGAITEATYSIFIYAEHPDVTAYHYQFCKSVMHAGKELLLSCGLLDVSISGGELAPDENYMPENMYVRVCRVKTKQPFSAPRVLRIDPARVRLSGLFAADVNVDGVQGGITVTAPTLDEDP